MIDKILKKINETLKKEMKIAIDTTDLLNGITRPSIRTQIENIQDDLTLEYSKTTFTVDIYYFSKKIKDNKLENLKASSKIVEILNKGFKIDNHFFYPEDIQRKIVDSVLVVSIENLSYFVKYGGIKTDMNDENIERISTKFNQF